MNHLEPATYKPALPDPTQDRFGRTVPAATIPARLAALLHVVRVLLGHGRRLVETLPERGANVQFAALAAVCGTYNQPTILARLQRGILRAMALERYLLARAAKGREIDFVEWRPRPPAKPPAEPQDGSSDVPGGRAKAGRDEMASEPGRDESAPKRRPSDPDDLRIPTDKELDAEVRRRPFGRTIASICLDLAVIPGFCTGAFWNQIFETLQGFGGSLSTLYKVREQRETSFQTERDRRPDTWDFDWTFPPPDTVHQLLGYLIGEAPIFDPPGPRLATAPP